MVVFWFVLVGVLSVLFAAWYAYACPPRKWNPPRGVGPWRAVVEWNTMHTRKECPGCDGWGDLLLRDGKLVKIPRHLWEHAVWVKRGLTMTCPSCLGLGTVARNWKPPPGR
jgi:hypothetical protein